MSNRIHYTPGMRFGRLTLIEKCNPESSNKYHHSIWLCKCDCGNFVKVSSTHLRDGHTRSCGCIKKEGHPIHGYSDHTLYNIHRNMKRRCYSPKSGDYSRYGGRGITICKEWYNPQKPNVETFREFFNWSIINGWKPGLQIDRIDVNGNYCPENCRYVPQHMNCNNRRDTRYIELDDIIYPISILAYILGIDSDYFYNWLYDRGFNINCIIKTIDTPIGPRRYFTDLNGNIIPTNIVYFTLRNGEYVSQIDYIDPEPMYLCYNIDKNGFITGPLI